MWLWAPMAQGQTHSSPGPPNLLTPHLWEASTWRCPSWRRRGSRSRAEGRGSRRLLSCPGVPHGQRGPPWVGVHGEGALGALHTAQAPCGLWEASPLGWGCAGLIHLPRGAAGNRGASLPAQLRSLTCRSPTGRGLTLLPQAQAQAPLQRGPRRSSGMGLGAQGRLCGKASGSCVPRQVSAILGRHREGRRVGERAPSCGAARRARAPSPRAGTGHAS